jgi:hypothetical protein
VLLHLALEGIETGAVVGAALAVDAPRHDGQGVEGVETG